MFISVISLDFSLVNEELMCLSFSLIQSILSLCSCSLFIIISSWFWLEELFIFIIFSLVFVLVESSLKILVNILLLLYLYLLFWILLLNSSLALLRFSLLMLKVLNLKSLIKNKEKVIASINSEKINAKTIPVFLPTIDIIPYKNVPIIPALYL